MIQGSNFLEGSFSNRDNRFKSNFQDKDNPSILKDDFSSKTHPSIFTFTLPQIHTTTNAN